MPTPPNLIRSYGIFKAHYDATLCAFLLLAMRRLSRPVDTQDVVQIFSLDKKKSNRLLDTLLHFGYIVPNGKDKVFKITQSGIDLVTIKPFTSTFYYCDSSKIEGDRLPSYIAYDLLPLCLFVNHLDSLLHRGTK